jgi:hypothetical protein
MATLISKASGNWTDAATWGVAEAGTGAIQATSSYDQNTEATRRWSSAFTVTNAKVIEGVLLLCKRLNTTGTVSIALSEDNGTTATREVTVNAADLPDALSYVFFKFDSPLTGDGGTDYKVGIIASSGGNAAFRIDSTNYNWVRYLRTATTAAPSTAAADTQFVVGEHTAAGAITALTVTVDETSTSNDYGAVHVGDAGILASGTTAATAYYLRVSGNYTQWPGGILRAATTGARMPADSSFTMAFDCASDGQFGMSFEGGTLDTHGAAKDDFVLLGANAAANATSLTAASAPSGWRDNDEIGIASTTRTYSECERGALNGAPSGTALTVDGFAGTAGGVQYAHSGTAPTQAEIINLTRNVRFVAVNASFRFCVTIKGTTQITADYTEFKYCGLNDGNKYGIDFNTFTGSAAFEHVSTHQGTGRSYYLRSATPGSIVISGVTYGLTLDIGAAGSTWTLQDLVVMRASSAGINAASGINGTVQRVRIPGAADTGLYIPASGNGLITDVVAHSCAQNGVQLRNGAVITLANLTLWRNNATGLLYNTGNRRGVIVQGLTAFGNNSANIHSDVALYDAWFDGLVLNGDSSFATSYGLRINTLPFTGVITNSQFGVAGGIKTAHTEDISNPSYALVTAQNCIFASPAIWVGPEGAIYCSKYGQVAGAHRSFIGNGSATPHQISLDAAIYDTAAPSQRLTPGSATVKLQSAPIRKKVDSGGTATFGVKVRKSVVGDGAAYNGAQPRLILRRNAAAGISETVLATSTVAGNGAFEELTGTSGAVSEDCILEAIVDCDGTAGWVNVDD